MKLTTQQVKSFIKFDFPVDKNYISAQFASTHLSQQLEFPECSTDVSRQKLISAYWFNQVAGHFALIVGISVLLSVLFFEKLAYAHPGPVLFAALISFPILLLFHYWPSFSSEFLPKLEMIISGYKQEKTILQLKQELLQMKQELKDQQKKASCEQEQIIMQFREQLSIQQDQAENQRQQFQTQLQEKVTEQQAHLLKQQETIQYRFQYKIINQKEQIDHQQDSIKKCHQAQLSNFLLQRSFMLLQKQPVIIP